MDMTGGLLELLHHGLRVSLWGDIGQWVFFDALFTHLDDEVMAFQKALNTGLRQWVGYVALTLMTIWILWQGFLIVTGRSRDSMAALMVNSGRQMLIVTVATTMMFVGTDLYQLLCGLGSDQTSLLQLISALVSGEPDPFKSIDGLMDKMSAVMAAIDMVPALPASMGGTGADLLKADKDSAQMWMGLGVAGPSVVAGALLFMYKMALGLFVGLAPIFILSLLFEQTKGMFQRWLWYGVGTMFSLAVLAFMVAVVLKIMDAVVLAMVAQVGTQAVMNAMTNSTTSLPGGMTGLAMQQGGLGMVMTVMLISVPPMAAAFFQGAVVSGFSAYSQFGQPPRGGADPNTPAGQAMRGSPPTSGDKRGGTGDEQNRTAETYNNSDSRVTGNSPPPKTDEIKKNS